jgi:hypothetical protein
MPRPKSKPAATRLEQMLDEASWLLSHAQALGDYGRSEEAGAERARAAICEEHVASLLEADGQDREAAIHRVSAASCYQQLSQHARAVTLLRAALSADLPQDYRARVERQLTTSLAQVRKELRQPSSRARSQASGVP